MLFVSCCLLASLFLANSQASAAITLTPSTWNIVGLDSNSPAFGPRYFPVGTKVCSDTAAANVVVNLNLNATAYIYQRPGSQSSVTIPSIAAGTCADAFFEVEVNQTSLAFETSASYTITSGAASTPLRRELYVEHLISQSRNSISTVKLDGVSIPAGGNMNLVVGNTYTIDLVGGTATQGYNQFEAFINFPNTIFQILSVSTTYSADSNTTNVPNPNKGLYANACIWDNDTASPSYRSCIGSDDKAGGSLVTTTYVVKILSGGGTSQTLNTLLYDFSGSSFHYNADYSTSARIASIIDPAATSIAKSFSPASIQVNGASTLTFTITNPNSGAVSGLEFTDVFPVTPGAMSIYDAVTSNTCGGTLSSNLGITPLAAGHAGIKLSGGTVAGNSSCIVQVNVTANTASGTAYTNTSQNLLIKSASSTLDTGKSATANLTVSSSPPPPPPPSSCANPITLATWTMEGPPAVPPAPGYFGTLGPDVSSATASYVTVSGAQSIASNLGTPDNTYAWGGTAPTSGDGWKETYNSMANYFQFVLDTHKYGGVTVTFDGRPDSAGDWANPNSNVFINTRADAGAFTCYGGAAGPWPQTGKNSWTTISNIPAATTGTSTTTFRLGFDGSGNNKTGATYYLDNVIFKGCRIPDPPTMAKSFSTDPVAVGGTSTLTFTITNPNVCCNISGIAFTDSLPQNNLQGTVAVTNGNATVTGTGTAFKTQLVAGSIIFISGVSYTVSSITSNTALVLTANYAGATASGLTVTAGLTLDSAVASPQCGGIVTGAAGGTSINLSGGTLNYSGSGSNICTITATVKDSIAGPISNVSGAVTSTSSGTVVSPNGVARATLTAILPPVISKKFAPNPILANGVSLLTFLVTNPNQNNQLTGVQFTDTFPTSPANMTVITPLTASDYSTSGCGSPTFTPIAGSGSISFSGGTVAAGATCTVTVKVTAATLGSYANTSGAVSATTAGTGNTSSDTLVVSLPHPAVGLLKEVAASSAPSLWGYYLALPAGNNVYYQLSVYNDGDVPLNGVTVSDPNIPAASISGCAWKDGDNLPTAYPITLNVANNSDNKDFAYCVLGPITALSGIHTNTATASVTYGGTTYTDTDWANYATTGLTLAKSIKSGTPAFFTKTGDTLQYEYLVTNSGSASLNGPVTVTDNKATVTCPAVSTIGDNDNYFDPGESLTCTASYTVVAADVTAKSVTNTASASTPASFNIAATTSNSDSRTVPLAPDLAAFKANSVNGQALLGSTFKWIVTVANSTAAGTATFTNGQTLLTDELPTSGASYSLGTLTSGGATGTISCSLGSNTITCTASGTVTLPPTSSGTLSVTNGSPVVTGTGTSFSTQVLAGSVIAISGVPYAVLSVQSDTQLTLTTNYAGGTASGLPIPAFFSVPVTVTPSAAGTLVNPRGGGVCQADPNAVVSEIDETNNSCATNTVTVLNLPSLMVIKFVQTVSDPVNGTTAPKAIPGAVMQYSIQVINSGLGVVDNNKTVITDAIPANTAMCVSNACSNPPVALSSCSAAPACGLTLTYGTDVTFSSQVGGGIPYTYTPVPDANGFDANVTGVRINPQGILSAASGGNNAVFSVTFKVKIK